MDLSKDQIYVDKDKLDVFSFSIILLKKLSMNKILYESETNSYETSLSFTDIDVYYMNRKNSFIDKRHDISVVTHTINKTRQLNGETLDYLNCMFSFQDNKFCCTETYINKFKNYLYLNKNSITNGCIIDSKFYLKKENNMNHTIDDPHFKQKISTIGKSILFYKNYRNSFITFMILFSNYINNTRNTVNLNTMSKLMPLFDKLDNEEIISLPNEDIIIEFINKVLKYKSMLDKINKINPYSANCSTSIFKIKITNKDISLYVNGISVLNEVYLGRFKYMPHVGLMFFIKCITTMGKFDSLFIKIQKHIIRTT
jgi:hypothetical protein